MLNSTLIVHLSLWLKFYKNYVAIWILVDSPTVLISLGGLLRSRLAWKIDKFFSEENAEKNFEIYWDTIGAQLRKCGKIWK